MRTPMLALILLAGWQAALSAERKAVPVERPPFQAEVASIDHDWKIVFATEVQRQSLPAAELVCWGAPGEILRDPVIVLADGGLLAAEVTGIDKLNLNIDSLLLGPLTVPLDRVAGMVFQLPADLRRRTLLFDRIATQEKGSGAFSWNGPESASQAQEKGSGVFSWNGPESASQAQEKGSGAFSWNGPESASQKRLLTPVPGRLTDRIVLENGDELAGLLDRLDTDRVRLRTEAGPIEVDRRTVAAVLFNPALTRRALPGGLHAWVGLSDGSLIPASRIALDQQKLAISTLAAETWAALPEDLVFLQPVGGRAVYLSAIEPDDYQHEPYLELLWPWRRDRSVTGGRLRCGGRMYLTGLGMHTATRLTYRLDGSYQRFQADVGVDDSTGGRGSVQFRVLVDGQERFASGPVRGGEPPETVDVDLAGATRLELVVDFAERAHVLDHANWLDARLVEPRDR